MTEWFGLAAIVVAILATAYRDWRRDERGGD